MNTSESPIIPFKEVRRVGLPNWLRWILVLPAAVAAYFVVQIVNALSTFMLPHFLNWFVQFFNSWAGPIALVWAGAMTAPNYRFAVAITLTVLHAIVLAVIITLAIVLQSQAEPIWWLVVCGVVGLAGTLFVCVGLNEEKTLLS